MGQAVQLVRTLFALLLALVGAFLWDSMARAAPIDSNDVRVIDGDTIRVHHSQPNVRLVGFNAPETRRGMRVRTVWHDCRRLPGGEDVTDTPPAAC
jgi:endonuclease YncB( thermonuclease family)